MLTSFMPLLTNPVGCYNICITLKWNVQIDLQENLLEIVRRGKELYPKDILKIKFKSPTVNSSVYNSKDGLF